VLIYSAGNIEDFDVIAISMAMGVRLVIVELSPEAVNICNNKFQKLETLIPPSNSHSI
jgi:hypothetical protein